MKKNIDFLLNSDEPWTVYRTLKDLLDMPEDSPEVIHARKTMLAHPLITENIELLKHWPGQVISSHKSAGQYYHRLSFLADVGIHAEDREISGMLENVFASLSPEGLPVLPTNISKGHGGDGSLIHAWALCDAPLILYSAIRMGYGTDGKFNKGMEYLMSLARSNGWPCAVSKELGSFRGPGKKEDPCPYATLLMLKLLSNDDTLKKSREAADGVECLLYLWEHSRQLHPYMFYAGTDFRKLKVPFIWYDILHVADTLSQFDQAAGDSRFADMAETIFAKADPQGLFTPESEWKAWSGIGLGLKKKPSPWLTLLAYRIEKRMG